MRVVDDSYFNTSKSDIVQTMLQDILDRGAGYLNTDEKLTEQNEEIVNAARNSFGSGSKYAVTNWDFFCIMFSLGF